jgi:probable HAF family extracellular repeat protein
MRQTWFACTAALVMLACTSEAPGPTEVSAPSFTTLPASYAPLDLGTLGGSHAYALAVNNKGQIVGGSTLANGQNHAFLWTNGSMKDLGTLGGDYSEARGINDLGHVVGVSTTARGVSRAFLWKDGKMTSLGTLDGRASAANDINSLDEIGGGADGIPFIWANGVLRRLALPNNATFCDVAEISDHSRAVGQCTVGRTAKAIRWDRDMVHSIGSLGGKLASPSGVNKPGAIVGVSATAGEGTHPFLYQSGTMTDLTTQGAPPFIPYGINDSYQVVGDFGNGSQIVSLVWQSGKYVLIGGQAGVDTYAYAINEAGVVVGNTVIGNSYHAMRWSPQ